MSKDLKPFPPSLSITKILGPSFVILALGLGSGEVILWPYLVANYGLGIAWGAILGITFQFFINMEIERYALVKGESVFVGIAKIFPHSVYWFIISTFIGFGLPGIVAASAKVLAAVLGIVNFKWLAIVMLLVIGLLLSVGKTVYGTMEKITKGIILIGVPFIFILTVFLSSKNDWSSLASGLIGNGDGFWFLPAGISLATFFAAFAYSGAGGNLNLTQSIYIKEKGYGMGKYSQKIAGLFRGNSKEARQVKLSGEDFEANEENISSFKAWWKVINQEHFIVFLFIGALSMMLLMLLSFTTTYGLSGNAEGINFVINEGRVIGQNLIPIAGTLFLLVVSVMLFQTQLGVMDSTSRIMAENVAIARLKKIPDGKINLSKIYYLFLWAQIAFGIVLFLLNIHEPKTLIVLGAVINAFAMFVHTGLVYWLNHKSLPVIFRPGLFRKIAILVIFLFFGFFSAVVLLDQLGLFHFKI
ncbi:MAG: Uncharacterized protein G01um101413_30 [Parcubacteria group bacterium Gr01-1014_13]|nr:MAG: Uncharacterized protein G01um101413_30 [Parcubacteria group bacterium Gr01-1014_13]